MHFSGSWQNQEPTNHRGRLNSAPYICLSCLTLATPLCSFLGNTVGTHISSSSHWFPRPVLTCCCCCIALVVSNSVRPHRRQPTRLPHPWDSPGKKTGVGCHCLLQCMKVKSESEVAQSCLPLSDPMDCSAPGSSIHGIFQARVLEWGAIAILQYLKKGSSTSYIATAFMLAYGHPWLEIKT